MCIAKLDYEVSTVGYKDFLQSFSIRSLLGDISYIDGKIQHLQIPRCFYSTIVLSLPVVRINRKAISMIVW